jgi:predicted permease
MKVFARRLAGWFMTDRRDAELDDEIEAHLELLVDEYVRRGLTPDDARAAARREFGGVEQMKETYRDQRGLPYIDSVVQDLRYAARTLRRSPGLAAMAILSLALGIGATTAVFSVLNAVTLRPLPVPEPDRLVQLAPQHQGKRWILFNPIFEELRRRQQALSGMFAVNDDAFVPVAFDGKTAVYLRASTVSGNYFSVLGLSPAAGRLLTDEDDQIGGRDGCAVVIGDGLWTRHFGRDPGAVGRSIRVRSDACTIVGVAPAGFASHLTGYSVDIWMPLRARTDPKLLASHTMAFFSVMGRLRPGVSVGQAEAELTTLYQQIQRSEPAPPPNSRSTPIRPDALSMHLAPGAQGLGSLRSQFGQPLRIAAAVVGVVLLIAALNVATLLLARGAARGPELATRAALGAGRVRLARQLATEGALLVAAGGALGVVLAYAITPALGSLVSLDYTVIALDTAPDGRVIAVALAATALAALLAAILPAVRLSRVTLQAGMASEGRTTSNRSGQRLTRALVAAQLALALLLVTASGLLLRTMIRLAGVDPGFRPDHVVVVQVRDETPGSSFNTADSVEQKARRAAVYRSLEERLTEVPGVRAAGLSWLSLFGGSDLWLAMIDADRPESREQARVDYVSSRYFDAVGMHILRGRDFAADDREGALRVAVVNETFARQRFGGDAIGHRFALDYVGERDRPFTVVGIVGDSKYNDLREGRIEPMVWVPLAQAPSRISSVALRVAPGTEVAVMRRSQEVLAATAPQVMVRKVTTLAARVGDRTSRERVLLQLASGFGGLAILLAAVGLYGTLAYAVTRRRREIGVRLALGARPRTVLRMVLGDALRLVAAALAAGVPLALMSAATLRAFLFGVEPRDTATLAGACAVLAMVAVVAAYVPARRAADVDPIVALRYE